MENNRNILVRQFEYNSMKNRYQKNSRLSKQVIVQMRSKQFNMRESLDAHNVQYLKQKINKLKQQKLKYKLKLKEGKQENEFLRQQKIQAQNALLLENEKYNKVEREVLIPHKNFIQQKSQIFKELQQLKQKKMNATNQLQKMIYQKQSEITLLNQKCEQLKTRLRKQSYFQKKIDNLQNKNQKLEQQNKELLQLISQYQDKLKHYEVQKTKTSQDDFTISKVLQDKKNILQSPEQIELWQWANRIGQQAWGKHLQIEIRKLCNKKKELFELQKFLREREKKVKKQIKKFDVIQ